MPHRLYIAALQAARSNYKSSSPNETDHFLRLAAGATKSPRKRSALLWKRANYAHNFGRLNRAIPLYRLLLDNDVLPAPKQRYVEARLLDAHSLIGDLEPRVINEWGIALADRTFSAETIDTHIECLRSLVRFNFLRSDFAAAAAAVERMSAVAETYPGTPSAARALAWRAIILLAEGNGAGANDLAEEAMERASAVEDPRLTCDVLTVKIMTKAYVGDLHEALHACRQGVQLAERFRLFRFRNMCLANMSAIAMDVGLNDVAESSLLEVLRAAESNEVPADIAHGYFNLAVLRLTQRKFSEVNSLAERCLDAAQRAGNNFIVLSVHALLGLTALERGALQEARNREQLILKESRPYIGDDIVPIEHFLARMSEIANSTERGIRRLEAILTNPPPFVNACCILELQLELARLLGRTNKGRAREIALSVASAASDYGAAAISEAADRMLHRFGSQAN
jgi:tetratricopeptide (TPR) repeat protein